MHPVLLVHGINDTGARFDKMRAVLQARGFGPVHAMNITPSDGSIALEAMGEQVIGAIRALSETADTQQIDIVAFSMGALATRCALQSLDGRSSVRRFVSVSGPHRGTVTAYLSGKTGPKQMRPGSRFLRELTADARGWDGIEVFSFWSPFDLVVIPASSSALEGAHNRSFPVAVHHWMLSDDRVLEAVVQALAPVG
jgi:triacylglycerol esterase/lipase EstA (alpha/beta hydrolase family)